MKTKTGNLLLAFVVSAFFSESIHGQEKNKFEDAFFKETDTSDIKISNKFKNITKLSFYPDTLPDWFFAPPQDANGYIYAVGISDPDMEPAKAKELAIHRAKVLVSLYQTSKIQYYRDVYTSNKESGRYTEYRQRFETYFKISSINKVNDDLYSVVDSHFTRYNESLVLIRYTPKDFRSSEGNNLSAIGTVLYIEAQVGDAFEVQAEYEIKSNLRLPDSKYESAHYLYREKGNKFLSNSQFYGKNINSPVYIYKYTSRESSNKQPLTSYTGLWGKYTREFLRFITLNTEQTQIRIKNMGQKYNPEDANLVRQIASYFAQIKINGIVFERDSLKLNINLNEITSSTMK